MIAHEAPGERPQAAELQLLKKIFRKVSFSSSPNRISRPAVRETTCTNRAPSGAPRPPSVFSKNLRVFLIVRTMCDSGHQVKLIPCMGSVPLIVN